MIGEMITVAGGFGVVVLHTIQICHPRILVLRIDRELRSELSMTLTRGRQKYKCNLPTDLSLRESHRSFFLFLLDSGDSCLGNQYGSM